LQRLESYVGPLNTFFKLICGTEMSGVTALCLQRGYSCRKIGILLRRIAEKIPMFENRYYKSFLETITTIFGIGIEAVLKEFLDDDFEEQLFSNSPVGAFSVASERGSSIPFLLRTYHTPAIASKGASYRPTYDGSSKIRVSDALQANVPREIVPFSKYNDPIYMMSLSCLRYPFITEMAIHEFKARHKKETDSEIHNIVQISISGKDDVNNDYIIENWIEMQLKNTNFYKIDPLFEDGNNIENAVFQYCESVTFDTFIQDMLYYKNDQQ
jgi:hypothetical protein